jgi:ankyrin repeat protein
MKVLNKSESLLNEYVMNTSELSSSRHQMYTQQSFNNILSLRLNSKISTVKMTPFYKFSSLNTNINKMIKAIECNKITKIKEYLDKDSKNLNKLNEKGVSPLHIAVINGNIKIIKMLLKYGADPNILSEKKRQTPLHFAYIFKTLFFNQIINLLLRNNANPDIEDINHKKPCEYLIKYKESNEIENTLSNENDELEINDNMNISRYKNIISDINNQDSYNENKNNYTYTISDNEATITQSYTKRNSGFFNIEELINCKEQPEEYKKTKTKIIG